MSDSNMFSEENYSHYSYGPTSTIELVTGKSKKKPKKASTTSKTLPIIACALATCVLIGMALGLGLGIGAAGLISARNLTYVTNTTTGQ